MDLITIIILLLLAILLIIIYVQELRKHKMYVQQIDQLPGPASYPFIGTSLDFIKSPTHKFFDVMHNDTVLYGPGPYRTWLDGVASVHIIKPEHIELIVNNSKHITKSHFYKCIQPWLGTGLLTSTGSKWHTHRKMITPAFHFKILDNFIDIFVEKSNILVKLLENKANGTDFDLYPYITRCTLDIICETAMGVEINAQRHIDSSAGDKLTGLDQIDSEYVKAIYDFSDLALKRGLIIWYHSDLIWNNCKSGKRYRKCVDILHGFTNKVITERRETINSRTQINREEADDIGNKKRMAFLDLLLQSSLNGTHLTNEEIREEVDTFMFEGHDTTTAAICWSLFLLGNDLDVQTKVQEELDSIFQGTDREITRDDLADMKYLEMVIKETLRLYPSVPIIGRELGEDLNIDGFTVPKKTLAVIHIYETHRTSEYFKNPNSFNPENFSKDNVSQRHPYAYVPFSAGLRNCIGQKFAILEEKTVLASILRNYTIRSMESVEECQKVGALILRPANGVRVTLHKRQHDN